MLLTQKTQIHAKADPRGGCLAAPRYGTLLDTATMSLTTHNTTALLQRLPCLTPLLQVRWFILEH